MPLMFSLSGWQIQVSFLFFYYTIWTKNVLGWFDVTCYIWTVLFSVGVEMALKDKITVRVWPLKAHSVWWLSWGFSKGKVQYNVPFLHYTGVQYKIIVLRFKAHNSSVVLKSPPFQSVVITNHCAPSYLYSKCDLAIFVMCMFFT